ncbi:MAG: methyl-accepting chemotaxis protein [Synergistaceae bacterium]|nr:methyl-accepting chemotaxis protein [Synergistaceae bacterium]
MNTLRGRLLGIFLVLSLGGLAIIGFLSVSSSNRALVAAAEKEGLALGKGLAVESDMFFRERLNFLILQSQRNVVRSMEWETQKTGLSEAAKVYGDLVDLWVVSPDGSAKHLTGAMTDFSGSDGVKKVLSDGKTYVSPVTVVKSAGKNAVIFAVPVESQGKRAGVLAAAFDVAGLDEFLAPVRWGATGYAYVTDRLGIITAHPNKGHIGVLDTSKTAGAITPELAEAMKKGLAGQQGLAAYFFEGDDKYVAFYPIPTIGGVLGMTSTVAEFLAPVRAIRNTVIIAALVVALLVIAVSLWMAGSIASPIRRVAEKMALVAAGDLTSTVELRSSLAEVKLLVDGINSMITLVAGAMKEISKNSRDVLARAEDMSAAAEESTASIEEVMAMAEKASSNTETAAASVEETNAGVEEVAAGAQAGAKAAVEAGEAGRGFAVVAEEVRKLAEESNRAAGEVGKLIGEISSRTDSALRDSANSSKILKDLVVRADETSILIADVVKRVNNVAENIQTIAATMEEQSASAEEMTAGMDSVAKSSSEIADQVSGIAGAMQEQSKVVESIASASEELVNLSAAMEHAVSRFRTGEENRGLVPETSVSVKGKK